MTLVEHLMCVRPQAKSVTVLCLLSSSQAPSEEEEDYGAIMGLSLSPFHK